MNARLSGACVNVAFVAASLSAGCSGAETRRDRAAVSDAGSSGGAPSGGAPGTCRIVHAEVGTVGAVTGAGGSTIEGGACEVATGAVRLGEKPGIPGPMAFDATNIYWQNFGIDPGDCELMKVPRSGGTSELLDWFACPGNYNAAMLGLIRSSPVALIPSSSSAWALDAGSMYFATPTEVRKVPVGGGPEVVLASGLDSPSAFALDAASVYFTTGNYVMRVSRDGCDPTVLASGSGIRSSIAVDATGVYFATSDAVMKVPLGGGASSALVTGQDDPCIVAVQAGTLYWATRCGPPNCVQCGKSLLMKMPLAGGTPTCAMALGSLVSDIVIDGTTVYYASFGSLSVGAAGVYASVIETNTLK